MRRKVKVYVKSRGVALIRGAATNREFTVVNSADYPVTLTMGQIFAICYRVLPTYVMEVSDR